MSKKMFKYSFIYWFSSLVYFRSNNLIPSGLWETINLLVSIFVLCPKLLHSFTKGPPFLWPDAHGLEPCEFVNLNSKYLIVPNHCWIDPNLYRLFCFLNIVCNSPYLCDDTYEMSIKLQSSLVLPFTLSYSVTDILTSPSGLTAVL